MVEFTTVCIIAIALCFAIFSMSVKEMYFLTMGQLSFIINGVVTNYCLNTVSFADTRRDFDTYAKYTMIRMIIQRMLVSKEDGKGYKMALTEFSSPREEFFQGIISTIVANVGPLQREKMAQFYNIPLDGSDNSILTNQAIDILMDYSMLTFTRLRVIEVDVAKLNKTAVINDKAQVNEADFIMSQLVLKMIEDLKELN